MPFEEGTVAHLVSAAPGWCHASQLEGPGFKPRRGHCGHCVCVLLLHVTGAHTLGGD